MHRKKFEICRSVLILHFNLKDCVLGVFKTRLGHIPVYLIGQDNHVTQMDELEKTERQNSNSRKSDQRLTTISSSHFDLIVPTP